MMSFFKELQSKYQKQTLIISFVTGFVSDFLSPLGPILKYISILGFSILLIITLIYFLKKSDFFKNGTIELKYILQTKISVSLSRLISFSGDIMSFPSTFK